MLRNENRMAAHGRLFSVVDGFGEREPHGYEIGGVRQNGVSAATVEIGALLWPETEP